MDLTQLIKDISRRKHFHLVAAVRENNALRPHLTVTSLTSLGVGCIVGAGIFVITGQAAAIAAGPALAISFVLSAVACFFCGLCYAELAAAIPVAGSAYTFTYVAIGEFAAWIIAICLILEYLVSTAAVTVGWSASVQAFLREFDITFPTFLSSAPLEVSDSGRIGLSGSLINLPAVFINVILTTILCSGIKESTTFNNIFVAIKLSVLAVFVGYGAHYAFTETDTFTDNLTPFIPPNTGEFGKFGFTGILRGAGMVFFSYVGFDAVCAMAQECKNPGRDLPRGLLAALVVCTILYVVATVSLTGMVKYNLLNVDDPVPRALSMIGAPPIIRYLVDIGAIAGLTSCCLVAQMCTPRLFYSLSVDGLLPKWFGTVHETYRTPYISTIFCGTLSAVVSGLLPLNVLGEVVSAGTLMAFMMVCVSVIALRKRHPDYPRPFKVPFVPLFPAIGIALCAIQMFSLPARTMIYYVLIQSAMFVFYLKYGRGNSVVAKKAAVAEEKMGSAAHKDFTSTQDPHTTSTTTSDVSKDVELTIIVRHADLIGGIKTTTAVQIGVPSTNNSQPQPFPPTIDIAEKQPVADTPTDDYSDFDSDEENEKAQHGLPIVVTPHLQGIRLHHGPAPASPPASPQ